MSFDLVFDCVLSENRVNRRRACEESKRGKTAWQRRRNNRLDDRHDRRNMNHHRLLDDLQTYVSRGAERAIRVGDVSLRMDVNNLNRPAGNDQRDTQQREDKPPRALHIRS